MGADLGVGLSLGLDVGEHTRVFGQQSRVTPGPDADGRDALGVGFALVF